MKFNASWGLKGLKCVAEKNNKWHCIISIRTPCRATYKFSQKDVTAYFSSSYFLLSLETWAEVCEYHRMVIWPPVTWPLDHANVFFFATLFPGSLKEALGEISTVDSMVNWGEHPRQVSTTADTYYGSLCSIVLILGLLNFADPIFHSFEFRIVNSISSFKLQILLYFWK